MSDKDINNTNDIDLDQLDDLEEGASSGTAKKKPGIFSSMFSPQNRVTAFIGLAALMLVASVAYGVFAFLDSSDETIVDSGEVRVAGNTAKADAELSDAYKQAVRKDDRAYQEQQEKSEYGVSIPQTFNEPLDPNAVSETDISNCGCTPSLEAIKQGLKELGVNGFGEEVLGTRIGVSDIYISKDSMLMDSSNKPYMLSGKRIFMQADGALVDESGTPMKTTHGKSVWLSDKGSFIDEKANQVDLYGDVLSKDGVVILGDGLLVTRKGNTARVANSDIYITKEKQLVTIDGKPIRHSGAYVYKDDDNKLLNINAMSIAWEGQSVLQNMSGHLVKRDGGAFVNEGILFSYGGILIDNLGKLTKPLVEITRLGDTDIYITKKDQLTDGYGAQLNNYGYKVSLVSKKFLYAGGRVLTNRTGNDLFFDDKYVIKADVGKGFMQSGAIKTADGVAYSRNGRLITQRGMMDRKGTSDIYVTLDGLLAESNGKTLLFNKKDTFTNPSITNVNGSEALETYDMEPVLDKNKDRVFLAADGTFESANGVKLEETGILTTSDNVAITAEGKPIVASDDLEQVVDADGNPLQVNGRDVYRGKDGKLYYKDGTLVKDANGQSVYLNADGELVNDMGRKASGLTLRKSHRDILPSDLTTKKLTTKDGRAIQFNGEDVFVGKDGQLLDASGNPILDKDGKPMFVDANGNITDSEGNLVDEEFVATGRKVGQGDFKSKNRMTTKDGKPVTLNGEAVFVADDGTLLDEDGNPILGEDGKPLRMDKDGNIVDSAGNRVDPGFMADGKKVDPSELSTRKQLTTKDGKPIMLNGEEVFVGENGMLLDANGNPILGEDGKPLYANEDGEIVNAKGELVDGNFTVKGDKVKQGEFSTKSVKPTKKRVTTKDGKPVTLNGDPVFVAEDGTLLDASGNPILGEDGKPLRMDADGNIIDSSGKVVDAGLMADGKKVKPGDLKATEQLTTKDGTPIMIDGKEVFVGEDGQLVDENGNPILGEDGKPLFMSEDGTIVNADGELADVKMTAAGIAVDPEDVRIKSNDKMMKVGDSELFISEDGLLLDESGKPLLYNGKKVRVGENGQLLDENGNPVLDKDGNPVYLSEDGTFIDSEGKPSKGSILKTADGVFIDSKGNLSSESLTKIGNSGININEDGMLVDDDGRAIQFDGQDVRVGEDGRLYYADGTPVVDENGNSVFLAEDGTLVDRNGNKIKGSVLTNSDGVLLSADGTLITENGQLTRIPGTDLYRTKDGRVVTADGKPFNVKGKSVYVNEQGQLVDANGRPIRYRGEELFLAPDGSLVNSAGELVTDKNGQRVMLGEKGIANETGEILEKNDAVGRQDSEPSGSLVIGADTSGTPGDRRAKGEATKQEAKKIEVQEGASPKSRAIIPKGTNPEAKARVVERYTAIRGAMLAEFGLAKAAAAATGTSVSGVVGGTPISGLTEKEQIELGLVEHNPELKEKVEAEEEEVPEDMMLAGHAGSVIYGTLAHKVNTDFSTSVLINVVGVQRSHPLFGAKMRGNIGLQYDNVVATFDTVILADHTVHSMNGVGIDPKDADFGLDGEVDSHFWYRYGGVFLSSMMEGVSEAMGSAGERTEEIGVNGTTTTSYGLDSKQLALKSLGKTGAEFTNIFRDRMNRPITVVMPVDQEVGVMLFDNIEIPEK